MLQLILIAAVIAALFYYYGIKPMTYWKERGVKQSRPMWVLGDNWRNIFKLESFPEMVSRTYNEVPGGRYYGTYQFTLPTLVIRDPELIKQIGIKDFEHFVDHRTFVSEDVDPLFGKNLFTLKGQRWREMRMILSPVFTGSKMKDMFVLMSECAKNFTNYFLEKNQDIVDVEMRDSFTRYTNDVIATTAFGIKTDSLADQTNEFYMMGRDATNFGTFRRRMKFFANMFSPKLCRLLKVGIFEEPILNFFTELVDNNINTRKERGIVRTDMIHLLTEAQKGIQLKEENTVVDNGFATVEEADLGQSGKTAIKQLTNMDIAAQAMLFFFAGFDGVSILMCFMAYELAVNPDIQKRLREEVEQTLQECSGDLTHEALIKMKYLDMVVSETLRKWPIASFVDRICTKPYTIKPATPDEEPLHLQKDAVIWFPVFAIHRDPAIYPNPERFDPERFNDENKGDINPYTYLAFGVGPRNCIGNRFALLEIKVVMFYLLSKFEIVPTSKTVIPVQISRNFIFLQAEGGYPLGLKRLVK